MRSVRLRCLLGLHTDSDVKSAVDKTPRGTSHTSRTRCLASFALWRFAALFAVFASSCCFLVKTLVWNSVATCGESPLLVETQTLHP